MLLIDKLNKWPYELVLSLTDCENRAYFESSNVLPERPNCLRAFKEMGPEDVRVVIVGPDPYHSRDSEGNAKAYGRAFAYNPEYQGAISSSMLNIMREIGAELDGSFDVSLGEWVRQGVLLLNTCLTVEEGKSLSHQGKYGWEQAILEVLKFLHTNSEEIVYVAWGNHAQRMLREAGIPEDVIVATSHPSRYSAHAGRNPFSNSGWHIEVNSKLDGRKIEWRR